MDNFTEMTMKFLKHSNMHTYLPSIEEIELVDNGKRMHMTIEDYLGMGRLNLDEHFLIQSIIFFTLLDNYIDQEDPSLIGESFGKKCKCYSPSNYIGSIAKELFRIMKIIRNSVVHTRSITSKENGISINYTFNKTNFKLKCSKYCIELVYSITFLIFDNEFVSDYQMEKSLIAMYSDLLNGIEEFNDEFGDLNHSLVSNHINYKWKRRYLVKNPRYEIKNQNIIVEKVEHSSIIDSCDYLVEYEDIQYLIPEEVIDENRIIAINDIDKFKTNL